MILMHISSRNEEESVSKTNNSLNISIDSLSEILDLEDCGSLNAKIDCRDRISGILETFSSDSDLLESLLICCQKTVSHMKKFESCLISKEAAHESDIESATIMGDSRKTMHLSSAIKKSKKYCKEDEQFVTDLFLQCSIEEQFKLIISSAKSSDDLVSRNFIRVKIFAENFNF
jgi:hypothetical protein